MKLSLFIILLFVLGGCEAIGKSLKEKEYTLQVHETPYSRQMFGYNTDYGYVGFMMTGSFGNGGKEHMHNGYCDHTFENSLEKSPILRQR